MNIALQIAWPVALAAAGWLVLEFLGRPVGKFFDLRGEVIRTMTGFANTRARWKEVRDGVGASSGDAEELDLSYEEIGRLNDAKVAYRDLASQLRAFAQNEYLATWVVRRFGYEPAKASAALIGMSNTIGTYGGNRAFQTRAVEEALRITDR
jgi:hypothetical protein